MGSPHYFLSKSHNVCYNYCMDVENVKESALSIFVKDFACKGEIIAKLKNRKPISKIREELTYKISENSIIDIIWNYLVEENIVLLYDIFDERNKQYEIVKKENEFGKIYFKREPAKKININDYDKVNIKKLLDDKITFDKLDDFEKEIFVKLPFDNKEYFIKRGYFNV